MNYVQGNSDKNITLYALSTCGWCKKTRQILDEMEMAYRYEYVDLLEGEEREEAIRIVSLWNPENSFPTLIVGEEAVAGYKEDKIRKLLRY